MDTDPEGKKKTHRRNVDCASSCCLLTFSLVSGTIGLSILVDFFLLLNLCFSGTVSTIHYSNIYISAQFVVVYRSVDSVLPITVRVFLVIKEPRPFRTSHSSGGLLGLATRFPVSVVSLPPTKI